MVSLIVILVITFAALVFLIFSMAMHFVRISPLAAALLIPYLLWCCYAAALTFSLVRLNDMR